MKRIIQKFILFFIVLGCVEPYKFVIPDKNPHLVIDSFLSDKSFNETLAYPSDGRRFFVKLRYTSEVSNVRDELVSNALVGLRDDQGNNWLYTETEPGTYILLIDDFKALPGIRYQQWVTVAGDQMFESEWSSLPDDSGSVGEVDFVETERLVYRYESGERVVRSAQGIVPTVSLPANNTGEAIYYRWTVSPMWIYRAPFGGSVCWIVDPYYLNDFAIAIDMTGNYSQPLFFIETVRNDRIYKKFSALIVQQVMSEEQFFFWKELKEQNQGGLMIDKPPYNLASNYHAVDGDFDVSGYFGPVRETAVRRYFLKSELSYNVEDRSAADCMIPGLDVAPQCFNCLAYAYGQATNIKPVWWED